MSKRYYKPDYTIPYKPLNLSLEFMSWCNINLVEESNMTPRAHYEMVDHVLQEGKFKQVIASRGLGKTTVLNSKLALYVLSKGYMPNFGKVSNLMIFSGSEDQAIGLLEEIIFLWENSEELQKTLKLDHSTKKNARFINENGVKVYIQVKGSGQSLRGTKRAGVRPELLLFDDILSDDALFSKTERLKVTKWFMSSIRPAVDISHYKMIVVGTPFAEDDILNKMKLGRQYSTLILPVCNEFPVPRKEDIVSVWRDRFTKEEIWELYQGAKEMDEEGSFYREYMLETSSEEMRVFKDRWLKYYDYDELKDKFSEMNFFTTMDIAVGKRTASDFSVVMTIGVDKHNNWFLVAIEVGKFNPSEIIEIMFEQIRKFRPIDTRVEKASLQQVLDHFIELEMTRTNTYFNYGALELNSIQGKEARITALQPKFKMGQIRIPDNKYAESIAELVYEYKGFTKEGATTAHDDVIDALANFLDPNFVIPPAGATGSEVGGEEDWDFEDTTRRRYY